MTLKQRLSRQASLLLFHGASTLGATACGGGRRGRVLSLLSSLLPGHSCQLTLLPCIILTSACSLVDHRLVSVNRWTSVECWQPAACFALRCSELLPCALCSPLINRYNSCLEYKQSLNCPGPDEQLYLLKPNGFPSLFPSSWHSTSVEPSSYCSSLQLRWLPRRKNASSHLTMTSLNRMETTAGSLMMRSAVRWTSRMKWSVCLTSCEYCQQRGEHLFQNADLIPELKYWVISICFWKGYFFPSSAQYKLNLSCQG